MLELPHVEPVSGRVMEEAARLDMIASIGQQVQMLSFASANSVVRSESVCSAPHRASLGAVVHCPTYTIDELFFLELSSKLLMGVLKLSRLELDRQKNFTIVTVNVDKSYI